MHVHFNFMLETLQVNKSNSGCGSVGRAVTSLSRGLQFGSSHRQYIYIYIYILNIFCQLYWKDENKEKEAGKGLKKSNKHLKTVSILSLGRLPNSPLTIDDVAIFCTSRASKNVYFGDDEKCKDVDLEKIDWKTWAKVGRRRGANTPKSLSLVVTLKSLCREYPLTL